MMTKYGYSTIGVVSIIVFILAGAGILINNNFFKFFLIALGALLLIFTLYFFRDPERVSPNKDNVAVSPADGTVLLVKEVFDDRYIKDKAWQISIFMSPLNVHVNRIPVNGKVEYLRYIHGEYLIASHDKASEKNERAEFGINSKFGKIFFTQVAGYVARRIVYELKPGDDVKMGERFGMIRFGSRVDVVVPKQWQVKVKKGDKVTAGQTILFEYQK
ncbi:MAG: phosphatidylserine decarboxylase family protein [Ignavibacteria bacterium]|nr:phosphatidylserine decarboxylase family protein [Ignavibacteria bacterium]MCU7498731.1 phosphatidylserine decarboxylase family protein [Ignavibacteria bacterium]MCU7512074.1 phosphatidylserine decarboxylase family protein [Ignavibacteria bacterium]MCU7520607.1 phosphatidylserine decarboxylase family protein [Ignavibacteria bacterium]MCU7523505.1 phosphatidylserine decarboxylase family protein [Ignavibacteria bacterium]